MKNNSLLWMEQGIIPANYVTFLHLTTLQCFPTRLELPIPMCLSNRNSASLPPCPTTIDMVPPATNYSLYVFPKLASSRRFRRTPHYFRSVLMFGLGSASKLHFIAVTDIAKGVTKSKLAQFRIPTARTVYIMARLPLKPRQATSLRTFSLCISH